MVFETIPEQHLLCQDGKAQKQDKEQPTFHLASTGFRNFIKKTNSPA
jgi:hypothetical protein